MKDKQRIVKQLQVIPGVGPSIADDLYELGIRKPDDLKGKDAQQMYDEHCAQRGMPVDRCVLYVFRCAIYYASNQRRDPEKLKWWNWKDSKVS